MMTKIKVTEDMHEEMKPITLDELMRTHNFDPIGYSNAGSLIYLAAPYSHADAFVEEIRIGMVNKIAGILLEKGLLIYSPLSHGVPIARASNSNTDFETWSKLCRRMVYISDILLVLPFKGWRESVGVAAEVAFAQKWQMYTYILDLDDFSKDRPELRSQMKLSGVM